MSQRELILLTLKGMLAWLILSALVCYFGGWLTKCLFPLLRAVIMMTAEISPSLRLLPSSKAQLDFSIELSAWVLRPMYIDVGHFIPPGTELKSSVHVLHILVPLVIEGTILLVWPVQRWSQRLHIIALGLLTAILVVMFTLPALLLGHMEISFQEIAQTGNGPRQVPWFVDWMVFCEMGGNWLLAIGASWLPIQLQRGLRRA